MTMRLNDRKKDGRPTLWVLSIPKVILFAIGAAEDPVAKEVNCDNTSSTERTQFYRMESEVTGLKTIDKRHPGQVSHGEHKAKTIGGDVHGGEEGGFIVEAICNIPELESEDKPHGVGDVLDTTTADSLFASHADIDQDPEDETWAELVEGFDIKGADGGIELASDEPLDFV